MKEIGEKLKETRESIGITLDEVAEDLKMKVSQVESVENGDMKAFNDIFSLKYFIRDYSKYLGLNYEDMVDEFNEYLFDYTSKISIKEIKAAKNESEEKVEPKISSPYTKEKKRKKAFPIIIISIGLLIIIGFVTLYITVIRPNNDDENNNSRTNNVLE